MDFYFTMGEYQKALDAYGGRGDVPAHVFLAFAACNAGLGRMEEVSSCLAEFERRRPATFDIQDFARLEVSVHAQHEDAERVRESYRKAGIIK